MKRANRAPTCYLQMRGRGWQQEWYETASRDARRRAADLRKVGYHVAVSAGGPQVTPVGRLNMTLISISAGKSGDQWLERVPSVRCERLNPYWGMKALKAHLAGRRDVRSPGGLAAWIGRKKYGHASFQRAAAAARPLGHTSNPAAIIYYIPAELFRRARKKATALAQAEANRTGRTVAIVDQAAGRVLRFVRPQPAPKGGLRIRKSAGRIRLRKQGRRTRIEVYR